jgi:hypothetical protein
MEHHEYLDTIAAQLVNELRPILSIKAVTANTDLLGKYTEAAVRSLVHRIVHPLRVCTGAVIDHPMPASLRQIDLILLAPFPTPAIFEVEGFGLVPRNSTFGVLEVKRSNYSGVDDKLAGFLEDVEERKIVSPPRGPRRDFEVFPGISVICVLDQAPSAKLRSLLKGGRVVAIFEKEGETTKVRPRDVIALVNFLHSITWRYRVLGSAPNYPTIDIALPSNDPTPVLTDPPPS